MANFSSLSMPEKHSALAVFCRAPRLGTVKTRLAQTRGDDFALGLYRAMLLDTFAVGRALAPEVDTFACFTPRDEGRLLAEFWDGPRLAQCEGDLGVRMLDCFAQLRALGFRKIVLIGSDAPDLPLEQVQKAFESLSEAELVIGPSDDGGFYLIGASILPSNSLFKAIAWSSALVCQRLLMNLQSKGETSVSLLSAWRDVDDEADLIELRRRLLEMGTHAPQTREFLRQSEEREA